MLHGVLESIELLADANAARSTSAARKGSSPTSRASARNVERSLMLVTALNPHIGYENAAKIALARASREPEPARRGAAAQLVSAEDFDRWVDAAAMTRPGSG